MVLAAALTGPRVDIIQLGDGACIVVVVLAVGIVGMVCVVT